LSSGVVPGAVPELPDPAPLWQTPWRNRQPESKHSPPFTRRPGLSSRPAVWAVARAQGREKAGL